MRLILLPGMDGTGDLFSDFVSALPSWVHAQVVRYPTDSKLSLAQLHRVVLSALPDSEPFVLMAESFSSPIAVRIAAKAPDNLRGLVICAGFVSSPVQGIIRLALLLMSPILFRLKPRNSMIRGLLLSESASPALVGRVRAAISSVSRDVMADRMHAVLACDAKADLPGVSVPILYIAAAEDRLVRRSSIEAIKKIRPDVSVARIGGPHLIVQAEPQKIALALLDFLRKLP